MKTKRSIGFTVVELLVVIIVIGILATITVATYRNSQQHTAEVAMKNDLLAARQAIESARNFNQTLPTTFTSSPNVSLTLVPPGPHYSSLSAVQNGVLLSKICSDLVSEGLGKGLNSGGATDIYISGCGNWNHDSMQVTGWTSKVFSTPIGATAFSNYAASVPSGDSYHPNQQSVTRGFYTSLHSRFVAQGGTFPITSFWDSWASPTNGGVMEQTLPASDATAATNYCVTAAHSRYPTNIWHISQNDASAVAGGC